MTWTQCPGYDIVMPLLRNEGFNRFLLAFLSVKPIRNRVIVLETKKSLASYVYPRLTLTFFCNIPKKLILHHILHLITVQN